MVPELLVSSFHTSRAFYVDVLGFQSLFERADPDFAYLGLGDAQLMIESDHETSWRTADLVAPRGRGINLQIEVKDVSALRMRLISNRHPIFRDLAETVYDVGSGTESQFEFLVQDPDGYLLRFVEVRDT